MDRDRLVSLMGFVCGAPTWRRATPTLPTGTSSRPRKRSVKSSRERCKPSINEVLHCESFCNPKWPNSLMSHTSISLTTRNCLLILSSISSVTSSCNLSNSFLISSK